MDDKGVIVNVHTRHEESDVNVRALFWFFIIFVVFAVVTHAALWLLFKYYAEIFRGETNQPLTQIAMPAGSNIPTEPRLQPFQTRDARGEEISPTAATPVADLVNMRRNEAEAQTNAAWLDRAHGRVRLPIDVAKQLVLQRGLPVVNNTPGGGGGTP
jgi:hypothetical protein